MTTHSQSGRPVSSTGSGIRRALRGFWIVGVVGILGVLIALQGWRSVILWFDLITTFDAASSLLEDGRLPDRGVLASFGSFTPPGAVWLVIPGMLLFSDPRLFEYPGSVGLYFGTLLGIYLVARPHLGRTCAIVAIFVYGWSELGLLSASSLWQRFPLHFFYVWIVFGTVKWVEKNDAKFLALACISWSAGLYVAMEVAPAIFVIPVVWLLYRPPIGVAAVVAAAGAALLIWLPYLVFQVDRDFMDLRSQVLRQRLRSSNFAHTWCEPAQAQIAWPEDFSSTQKPDPKPAAGARKWLPAAATRSELIVTRLLLANYFRLNIAAGGGLLLFALTLVGMLAWWSGLLKEAGVGAVSSNAPAWIGGALVASGLALNEFVISAVASVDGELEPSSVALIRGVQAALLTLGAGLFIFRRAASAGLSWFAERWDDRSKMPGVIALCLIVPWSVLLIISDNERLARFWWIWPLQAMAIATAVTYLPRRLRVSPKAISVASIALVLLVSANSFVIEHLNRWVRDGWPGKDAPEIVLADYIASQLQAKGERETRIGYEVAFERYMAAFNSADSRYKVGAQIDLLLRYRHGIVNLNRCAEGVSPTDAYRIVETALPETITPAFAERLNVSRGHEFHLLGKIARFEVYRREPQAAPAAGLPSPALR